MKTKRLRIIIPLLILLLAGIGFVMHTGFGTISAIGWSTVSVLCPIGALNTMIASKTVVPRAVISLILAVVGILLLGRAFCGWICPVPVFSKLRGITKPQDEEDEGDVQVSEAAGNDAATAEASVVATATSKNSTPATQTATADDIPDELTPEEKQLLHKACTKHVCPPDMRPADSRHIVLGGALLSAAIFGFPVFCLVCPIGLSFALVFVLIQLFGAGTVTWSVIIIPVLLAVEVIFFRKWCSHICPVSSLMSLVGKANRTWLPSIDDSKCLETSRGVTCGRCGEVCEQGIDPRHPELGSSWSECTRCTECIGHCPGNAISMPFLPKASNATKTPAEAKDA
jgi:ferredoxin-type protein NapH